MHTQHHKTNSRSRAAVIAVCILCGIIAAVIVVGLARYYSPKPAKGYLPKDVPSTPAASPLASAPPEAALHSGAVTINLPADSPVGQDTSVSGTADSPNGTVYYRISDYRRGQIAAGEITIPSGGPQPFQFRPEFSRVYTTGDPATLDVYVLNASGAEQVTRLPIKLL